MTVSVFIEYIPYFSPPMWRGDITESMLLDMMLLLLEEALSQTTVSHKHPPAGRTVQEPSPQLLYTLGYALLLYNRRRN